MSSMNVSKLASNSVLSVRQQNSISQKSSLANSLLPTVDDSSLFGGYSIADYASIKNGSYGKLMTRYYAKTKAETGSVSEKASDSGRTSSDNLTKYEKNGTLDKLLSTYNASGASAKTEEVKGTELNTAV